MLADGLPAPLPLPSRRCLAAIDVAEGGRDEVCRAGVLMDVPPAGRVGEAKLAGHGEHQGCGGETDRGRIRNTPGTGPRASRARLGSTSHSALLKQLGVRFQRAGCEAEHRAYITYEGE
ncbi:hypothetical protein DMA10_06855 [Streptomyces sp. WAC 01420]|nr:hypothetical protein DLM49_29035 [Streptomyces sp. WAC 01438]RSM99248.1 hypothetical protein DMA10_06855 [Streptomyces sp. WAC 01420]